MSAASRATSARERANIAAAKIRAAQTRAQDFFDCFEMGDADAVVALLLKKAKRDARIMAYAISARWVDLTGAHVVCDGKPWDVIRHVQGIGLVLRTFNREITREASFAEVRVLDRGWA
jgi:hypothetical protein